MFALIKFELVFIVFKKNIFGWYWAHVQKFRLIALSLQIVPVVSYQFVKILISGKSYFNLII